jgi:hypothetical protein
MLAGSSLLAKDSSEKRWSMEVTPAMRDNLVNIFQQMGTCLKDPNQKLSACHDELINNCQTKLGNDCPMTKQIAVSPTKTKKRKGNINTEDWIDK